MGFFDNRSDTQKKIDEYYKVRNNNFPTNENQYNSVPNCNYQNNYSVNNQEPNYQNKVYVKPSNKSVAIIMLVFLIFFVSMILMSLLSSVNSFVASIMPACCLSMFALAGLSVSFAPIITGIIKKRRCKIQLKALVVDIQSRRSRKGKRSYAPVYEYSYMGTQYVARAHSYRNYALPEIGDEVNLLINEANPEDFYVDDPKFNIFTFIFGLVFAAIPLFMIFNFY